MYSKETCLLSCTLSSRAGPQNEKWFNQQITLDPTGSIHKIARKKSLTQKKLILIRGIAFEKNGPCSLENGAKISKKCKMAKMTPFWGCGGVPKMALRVTESKFQDK